jgi:trehalose 6-phosphate synthase
MTLVAAHPAHPAFLRRPDARVTAKRDSGTALGRVVIVSNRVPSPNEKAATAGGLAVALADAATDGSLWFGWSGRRAEETSGAAHVIAADDGVTYATIDIAERDYQKFYNGFANGALWPLLHYRTGLLRFNRPDYDAYRAVNRAFAEALRPLLQPDDVIWIHDYQLLTMGADLRALGVANRIGFFLHIPFVPPALFAVLPPAQELLTALAACDVIGFQTAGDVQAFTDNVAEFLDVAVQNGSFNYRGRDVRVVLTPIGIDAKKFARLAERAELTADAARLHESLGDRALVLGVDRLDYSKGLPQRFDAFGRLLFAYPQHRRCVNFLQIAARSRQEVGSYQSLRRELDRRAGDINGEFSDFDWVPLRYMTHAVKRNAIAGFYRRANIGLVTPLRDGMNLVAKEYVAAQDEENPGVLVLSRFAGAADELTEALIVNPFDADEVAAAIHQGLTMSLEERRERHTALLTKVRTTTAQHFCEQFLAFLRA